MVCVSFRRYVDAWKYCQEHNIAPKTIKRTQSSYVVIHPI